MEPRLATPNERKQAAINQLVYRPKAKRKRVEQLKLLSQRSVVDLVDGLIAPKISPASLLLLQAQIKDWRIPAAWRKWSRQEKAFSAAIWKRSRKAYQWWRTQIALPCESAIRTALHSVPLKTGVNGQLHEDLQHRMRNSSAKQKACVLSFDEVALKKGLYHQKRLKKLLGLTVYGEAGRTLKTATHPLVFMVRGLQGNWMQPLSLYFTKGSCPKHMLAKLMNTNIRALQDAGFNVVALVSDQWPNNRGALKVLRQSCEEGQYENVYKVEGSKISHIWDMPHILKNVRNNFITSDVDFGKSQCAQWNHTIKYKDICDKQVETRTSQQQLLVSDWQAFEVNMFMK